MEMTKVEFWQFVSGGWTPDVFTYIVRCEQFLKIGRTKNPEARLLTMQTNNPFALQLMWCWPEDVEKELHDYFAAHRVRGEWFAVPVKAAIHAAAVISKSKCRESMRRQLMEASGDQ